jgi:hypothetical protein
MPSVFVWNGPIDRQAIDEWLLKHAWTLPSDLVDFWAITGGGEVFESETFLRPAVSSDGEDEVAQMTGWCAARGIPSGLVVFHEGLGFTAVRCDDRTYVSLGTDLRVIRTFKSLDDWYTCVLRAEYATRYGLPRI